MLQYELSKKGVIIMKKLSLSTVALFALGTVLNAGGNVSIPPPMEVPQVVSDNWSGPYVGLQLGYIQGKADGNVVEYVDPTFSGLKPKGFIGGGYAGYNKLLSDNWLLGIELAANYTNIKKSATLYNENGYAISQKFKLKQKGEVALYAKFGKVMGANDSLLLYTLAGISGTKLEGTYVTESKSKTVYGFSVGTGLEYKLNKQWSTRVQYRFNKYNHAKFPYSNSLIGTVKNYKTHSLMMGVSYNF